jgi:hypothetical protein
MDKKRIVFIIATASLVVIGFYSIYHFRFTQSRNAEVQSLAPTNNRNYLSDGEIKIVRSFECLPDVWNVHWLDNQLYIQTWGGQNIITIDSSGKTLQILSKAGNAPGEFQQIESIVVRDSTIGVIDTRTMSVADIHKNTKKLLYTGKFNYSVNSGIKLADGLYLITKFDPGTVTQESFSVANLLKKETKNVLLTRLEKSRVGDKLRSTESNGFFTSRADKHGVFRVYTRAGQFAAFDTAGNPLYRSYTVDKTSLPDVVSKKAGSMTYITYAKDSRLVNLSACTDNNFLYILSNAKSPDIPEYKEGENKIGVVDAYNLTNGKYVFSFKVPSLNRTDIKTDVPSAIAVDNDKKMYVIQGSYMCIYRFPYPLQQ